MISYPYMPKAQKKLKKEIAAGLKRRYKGLLRIRAGAALRRELGYIKKQGSASGYLTVLYALRAAHANSKEFYFVGTIASSILAYVIGFSDIDPLTAIPHLYPV